MNYLARTTAMALACVAGLTISAAAFAEGKPYTPPIKFDFKIIPATGCVLRPTSAAAEFACTPDAGAMAACLNSKGEVGTIDGLLLCKSQRVAMGPGGKPSATTKMSWEPPFGSDAAAQARWRPIPTAQAVDLGGIRPIRD